MTLEFTPASEPNNLLDDTITHLSQGDNVAVVTLVNVDGGSPYPVGTQMLVLKTGAYLGQITGGCAERAIADHAVEAIHKGENRCVRYGAGSPFFDIQLPCGSGVDVLIDVETRLSDYQAIKSIISARRAARQNLVINAVPKYTKLYTPSPKLVLLGQGDILAQSCNLARAVGFDVAAVVNDETTRSLVERFDIKTNALQTLPDLSQICDEFSGVISLFHEHDLELDVLADGLRSKSFYIGALGSRKTHAARVEYLKTNGFGEGQIERIHGPVGVDIKASNPREIGVSIIAEAVDRLNILIESLEPI
ncbi:MAG: XdhC family protein [Gammaproteobacteria bacterium]|nr:XdhC family protein [Gammaproteobacteria bacterium]